MQPLSSRGGDGGGNLEREQIDAGLVQEGCLGASRVWDDVGKGPGGEKVVPAQFEEDSP